MIKYINFKESKNPLLLSKYPSFVQVLEDDSGNDWYDIQKKFSENTLKIVIDDDDNIISYSYDVSMLNPNGYSVCELDSNVKIPHDLFSSENKLYSYKNGKIVQVDNKSNWSMLKKNILIDLTVEISILENLLELDEITENEKCHLDDLISQRIKLYRYNGNPIDILST